MDLTIDHLGNSGLQTTQVLPLLLQHVPLAFTVCFLASWRPRLGLSIKKHTALQNWFEKLSVKGCWKFT